MSLKEILKDKTGSGYVEFLICFWLIMSVLAFSIGILGIFSFKGELDNAADTLIKVAETYGTTELDLTAQEIKDASGLNFTVSWEGTDLIPGTANVQLGDTIFVTLEQPYEIGIGKWTRTIPVYSRRVGMSEKFYK